jgi:hypothetical protein
MKTSTNILTMFILIFIMTSCKKEADISQAIQPVVSSEYIEFTIDGRRYSIVGSGTENTINADGAAVLTDFGFQKGLVFRFVKMNPLEMVGFSVYDYNYPMASQYTISGNPNHSPLYNPSEFGFVMEDSRQYIMSLSTTGAFEFTSIDSVAGAAVEGSFFLNNLQLTDKDGNTLSTGHSLTNGKFRVIIQG